MTILADYILPCGASGGQGNVRVIQGTVVLVAGAATQVLPVSFAGVPAEWPVMVARVNAGTQEGIIQADFDPGAGPPEINFASNEVTDDARLTFVMQIPTNFFT